MFSAVTARLASVSVAAASATTAAAASAPRAVRSALSSRSRSSSTLARRTASSSFVVAAHSSSSIRCHRAAACASVLASFSSSARPQPRSMASASSSVESLSQSSLSALDVPTESNTVFFLCDIQETFRGKILDYESLISTAAFLTRVANTLAIPVVTTEQKPFKPTVSELQPLINPQQNSNHSLFTKSLFSMLTPEVESLLASAHPARRHVVLFGIEAHVCVLQTTLDLLRKGFIVHVVADAVSSQNAVDRATAFKRMEAEASRSAQADTSKGAGCLHLTTAESILFEILRDAQHPKFKELVPAMKDLAQIKKAAAAGGGNIAPSANAKL